MIGTYVLAPSLPQDKFTKNFNLLTCNQKYYIIYKLIKIQVIFAWFLQKNAVFLQKKVKKLQNGDITYNFYQNGLVEVESQNEILFSEIYDFEILDADILTLNNGFVALKLFGGKEEACIVLNDKFMELDFFENAIIEKTDDGYKVLIDFKDIAGHGLVKEYKIEDASNLVDEYSVYLKGRPNMPSNNNVVPLYFAECIKAKDYTLAKQLLCDELKDIAKKEHLTNYFGNFVYVDTDWFKNEKNILCFEYQKNKKNFVKKHIFVLQDGQIVNIR